MKLSRNKETWQIYCANLVDILKECLFRPKRRLLRRKIRITCGVLLEQLEFDVDVGSKKSYGGRAVDQTENSIWVELILTKANH